MYHCSKNTRTITLKLLQKMLSIRRAHIKILNLQFKQLKLNLFKLTRDN